MALSPVNSFARFFFGFTLLISISFGVTYAVQKYASGQDAQQQQAAAAAAMLKQVK
ncbi:hypothetical protein HY971_02245 [Candidatus Kaiserbacteria bacterium]|nr:hypothetical protein [Candidatus Kaiserbacteria bacterium]